MKSVRLALQQIRTMFSRQKLFFILFFTGVTICSLVLTYYWGSGNLANSFENTSFLTNYQIKFPNPTERAQDALDKNAVSKLEQAVFPVPVKEYLYQSYFTEEQFSGVELSDTFLQKNDPIFGEGNFYVYSYRNNMVKAHAWVGRGEFTEEELSLGARVAVGPSELFPELDADHLPTVTLRGIPFEIIGAFPLYDSQWFLIPYQTLIQEDFPICSIEITLERVPTRAEDAEIAAILKEIFPDRAEIITPSTFFDLQEDAARQSLTISVVLYLIALLTMMFLMKYMLDCSRHEMVIYLVAGASKKRALLLLLLQNGVLVLSSSLVAFGLFFALKQPFFDSFSIAPDYRYTVSDLTALLLLELILSLLVALPFLLHFIRKTPVQLKSTAG